MQDLYTPKGLSAYSLARRKLLKKPVNEEKKKLNQAPTQIEHAENQYELERKRSRYELFILCFEVLVPWSHSLRSGAASPLAGHDVDRISGEVKRSAQPIFEKT